MSKEGDFAAVRKDLVTLLHQPEYDDGSAGPVLVRLAWSVPHRTTLHPSSFTDTSAQALCRHL